MIDVAPPYQEEVKPASRFVHLLTAADLPTFSSADLIATGIAQAKLAQIARDQAGEKHGYNFVIHRVVGMNSLNKFITLGDDPTPLFYLELPPAKDATRWNLKFRHNSLTGKGILTCRETYEGRLLLEYWADSFEDQWKRLMVPVGKFSLTNSSFDIGSTLPKDHPLDGMSHYHWKQDKKVVKTGHVLLDSRNKTMAIWTDFPPMSGKPALPSTLFIYPGHSAEVYLILSSALVACELFAGNRAGGRGIALSQFMLGPSMNYVYSSGLYMS